MARPAACKRVVRPRELDLATKGASPAAARFVRDEKRVLVPVPVVRREVALAAVAVAVVVVIAAVVAPVDRVRAVVVARGVGDGVAQWDTTRADGGGPRRLSVRAGRGRLIRHAEVPGCCVERRGDPGVQQRPMVPR